MKKRREESEINKGIEKELKEISREGRRRRRGVKGRQDYEAEE